VVFFFYTAWLVHSFRVHLANGTLDGPNAQEAAAASSSSTEIPLAVVAPDPENPYAVAPAAEVRQI
jgi:hypothetical protein